MYSSADFWFTGRSGVPVAFRDFAYDLFLQTSNAALFGQVSKRFWAVRGFVVAMRSPLEIIAAKRSPTWSVGVFVSQQIVFYTVMLIRSRYLSDCQQIFRRLHSHCWRAVGIGDTGHILQRHNHQPVRLVVLRSLRSQLVSLYQQAFLGGTSTITVESGCGSSAA
jgi:hypothetical protein